MNFRKNVLASAVAAALVLGSIPGTAFAAAAEAEAGASGSSGAGAGGSAAGGAGAGGAGAAIGPNEVLIFKVELVAVVAQ